MSPLPSFVIPVCFAAGVVLMALGVPLYLRRVPPNPVYGIRVRATRVDDRIWYEVNARAGRDLIVIAAVYLATLALAVRLGESWIPAFRVLGPLAVLVVGLIADTVILMATAKRLAGDHSTAAGI
jgi:uncharacterized membrane protein